MEKQELQELEELIKQQLTDHPDQLDPRRSLAVTLRLGLNEADGRRHTYKQIGEKLDISPEAARRLVKRAATFLLDCVEMD